MKDEAHSTAQLEDNNTQVGIEDEIEDEEDEDETHGERNLEEEEYHFFRLERLLKNDGATRLEPSRVFIHSAYAQAPTINVKAFCLRLKEFLQPFDLDIPTPMVLDELVRLAILAKKEIAAWENTVRAVKSANFMKSLGCLRTELERFVTIRKLLRARRLPSWMSSWEQLWIEAFEELQDHIEAHLRGTKSYMEGLSELAKFGRTEVESHVLLLHRNSIRELISKTPLSKTPSIALAAFAYAAQLVPSADDENDAKGRYLDAIKSRITRANRSSANVKAMILGTLIQGMGQYVEPGVEK